jgi:DNA (cytosine-5)-methyltransferase 1
MKPQIIDLFAGGGGFTLGAYQVGFSTVAAVDNDADLSHSFPINFPHTKFVSADISRADPKALSANAGLGSNDSFGIIGGPPCQGFSAIGKKSPKDSRNLLVRHFFRFVRELKPAFFIMENVPGILTDPFRRDLESVLDSISSVYEIVGPVLLDAADFGAATSRTRAIVVGYKASSVNRFSLNEVQRLKTGKPTSVFEAIHDLPSPDSAREDDRGISWVKYKRSPARGDRGEYARKARTLPPPEMCLDWVREASQKGLVSCLSPTTHSTKVIERFASVGPGERESVSRCPRLTWDKPSPTLRAGTGKDHGSHQAIRPIHPAEHRVITVREAARIQGFPDWFQFHPTKWHSFRMIGNSVSPVLAAALLKFVLSHLDDVFPGKGQGQVQKTG